jgi:transposase
LKSREAEFLKDACRMLGISSKHGYQLWNWYKEKDFDQYLKLNYKPGEGKLSSEQKALLVEKASDGRGFASQQEVRRYLKEEFNVSYTQPGVCLLLQRLKIKAKQPRPSNVKADKEEQREFKKTLARE